MSWVLAGIHPPMGSRERYILSWVQVLDVHPFMGCKQGHILSWGPDSGTSFHGITLGVHPIMGPGRGTSYNRAQEWHILSLGPDRGTSCHVITLGVHLVMGNEVY